MNKTHYPITNNYDLRVTIIRNPKDSIISRLAMELEYEANPKTLDEYLEICKKEYLVFFKYAIEHVEIIFDFNDINSHIDDMVNYICSKTGIERIQDGFVDTIADRPATRFLKTSTKSSHYNRCAEYMKNKDLTECDIMYIKVLEKAVKF